MAIEFVLPMIASILQSAIGQGLAANQAANARNEQIKMARERRQELQPIIDSLRKARDYFGVEEQLVRDFSRASDQMAAQSAQTGMTNAGSGGLDANRSDLLGSMLAQLAQYKAGEEAQRQQLLAELLSDPSLYAGSLEESNVGGQTLLGGLLGGVAGAGSQLNAYLSTPEGIGILQGLMPNPATAAKGAPQGKAMTPWFLEGKQGSGLYGGMPITRGGALQLPPPTNQPTVGSYYTDMFRV